MPAKKYVVTLTEEERLDLERAARSNKHSGLERQRARILLSAAHGQDDAAIATAMKVCVNTVANVRRRFCQGSGVKSVRRAEQTHRKERRLDGAAEAHLVALVCAGPPAGRKTWSLNLLAGKLIEARLVDHVTGETVRQTLKKMSSNPG